MGLKAGESAEKWNIENPEKIIALHKEYLSSGANIIKTNTFGINALKYENYEELIIAGINCAKEAVKEYKDSYIAFDIGPLGQLLEPLGTMKFQDAVELFAKNVRIAQTQGADLVLIETMNDSYETKAAVLAAKENCDLPVFVTNVYDESKKLMTGASPLAMISMLEGLKVDAIGINCSLGPDKMLPVVEDYVKYSSLPIIVNPNAGLPSVVNGKTVFNTSADDFAEFMKQIAVSGATILGGCCGTTPEYIKKTVEKTKELEYSLPKFKNNTVVSSYTTAVEIGKKPVLIGERINPTGKKKLKEALRNNDLNYILNEGISQAETGVEILDVNVGLPEIDEVLMMKTVVEKLQSVTDLPLQIDTSNPSALQTALRIYNGKPLINSVNGKEESMNAVFPLVKKYGGVVIALTLDENGIPSCAEERVKIAEKIITKAKEYGIDKKDIIVDPLAMAVSSDSKNANITLNTIKKLCEKGILTSLGVSNISFGLPNRSIINSTFFSLALENGLNLAIMNPFSKEMMDVFYGFCALKGIDSNFQDYIAYATNTAQESSVSTKSSDLDLHKAIVKGVCEIAVKQAQILLETMPPLEIINAYIIPALNEIGKDFENQKAFLPQLLMSAEASSKAFEVLKSKMNISETDDSKAVILATVKGDIHDIGKNIVKVLLESYGFKVYDLGKDVPPETILEYAQKTNCKIVGLSSLMTTTVPSMADTIKLLKSKIKDIKVMVGGAVLTQEYAEMIKADHYAPDAIGAVKFVDKYYN
ncbi:MAG: homocysteine S-methyltransferase family protein [Clostridia bacterium]|nr:homocysteine S-methyltransferase family protein [Clostridia bacterium]